MTIAYLQNSSNSTNGYLLTPPNLSVSTWLEGYLAGQNKVVGGSGNDIVEVNGDSNLLTGGAGRDIFSFFTNPTGYQIITDFTSSDIIVFKNIGFSGGSSNITLDQGPVTGSPSSGHIEVSHNFPADFSTLTSLAVKSEVSSGNALYVNDGANTVIIFLEGSSDISSALRVTNSGNYSYSDPGGNAHTVDSFMYLYAGTSSIAGAAIGGNQLTATISDSTFLSNAPSSGVTYSWFADSTLVATSSVDDSRFTPSLSLLGKHITVSASYVDGYGNAETSALSSASAAVNGILAFAADVANNLDVVQANHVALSGNGVSFQIYDGSNTAVNATIAQLTSDADAITLIKSHSDSGGNYRVGVADTAAHIESGINTLITNGLAGKVDQITISDLGIVHLNSSQETAMVGLAGANGINLSSYTFDNNILVNHANDGTLYIKAGGILSSSTNYGLVFFNGAFSTGDGIYASASSIVPFFHSSGGINGLTLPDLFTGPSSLGLTYQLIDSTQNAVVTGASSNDFIKVSDSNSVGKAVNGGGGNDVIDGGVGSTFVTGGDNHNTTFFLDGRAPGTSWSTITDFKSGVDKATIWGFVKGVSSVDTSFTNYDHEGATGYQGLTLHFKNLLPDGQTSGSNANLNSITFTGHTLAEVGATSLADLNNQINNGTNAHILVGATQDSSGTHSYLYFH